MALDIEKAWKETKQLEFHADMSSRFWVFRAFYGILTPEQQERYITNINDMKSRETEFKRIWLEETDPTKSAREVIAHYAFILGYHPNCAQTNHDISDAFVRGYGEYDLRTRPERERAEALERAVKRKMNSD